VVTLRAINELGNIDVTEELNRAREAIGNVLSSINSATKALEKTTADSMAHVSPNGVNMMPLC
jgi:hypothetical protein